MFATGSTRPQVQVVLGFWGLGVSGLGFRVYGLFINKPIFNNENQYGFADSGFWAVSQV